MKIEADGLERKFSGKYALRDVSFECRAGEVICLIGNNGAGKTTLLQLLGGILSPTRGEVRLDGKALDRRDEAQRRVIGILPDFPPVFAKDTVIEHLAMMCALHKVDDPGMEERALTMLKDVGLLEEADTPLGTLSRGQVYKTALVGMLLARPGVWLLDEPMASGMDPLGLDFLRSHLRRVADEGAVVMYSTQIPELAERFSDRVLLLHEGRVLALESAGDLLARTGVSDLAGAFRALVEGRGDV